MVIDRSVAPPSQPIRQIDLVEATTHHLPNGVPVHSIRAGKQPILGIEVIFRQGGIKHESQDGACFLTLKMLSEGTRHRSAYQISQLIDSVGAYLRLSPGTDRSSVEVYTISKHADVLLRLLRELLTEAAFPQAELAQLKARQKQQIRVSNEKSNVVASRKMKRVLFGEQAYGKSLTEASTEAVSQSDLLNFYENNLRSSWEIILSGDVTDEIKGLIAHHLGDISIPPIQSLESTSELRFMPTSKGNLVKRPKSLQSSIRMGVPLFKKDHPDYYAIRILNTVLGGYFGSRLMRNIREEKGLTYGISSGVITPEDGGYLMIGTDVRKELTQLAMDEIYREIEQLRNQPVTSVELKTVTNYLAGRFLNSVDTPFALAEKFKNIYSHGLTYDFYRNYLKMLDTITPERIQEVAHQYLRADRTSEVVVGEYA